VGDTVDREGIRSNAALSTRRGCGVSTPGTAGGKRRRRRRVERGGVEGGASERRGGRDNSVHVRLTDEELTLIEARAVGAGLTTASYLAEIGKAARPAVLASSLELGVDGGGDVGAVAPCAPGGLLAEQGRVFGVLERRALAAELLGVRRILSGVATNLNQLAKVANSTGQVPPQVNPAADAVLRYLGRLEAVVAVLDPRVRS
jgi:hypothetical protein